MARKEMTREQFAEWFCSKTTRELAAELGCTPNYIQKIAAKYGIKKERAMIRIID